MDSSYDVIVVGAGPAGSMAALKASQNGARTLLLEKHEAIGQPVCCAEAITTVGLERVLKARPEWISHSIKGASIEGPSGRSVTILHKDAGYVLNRHIFDAGLARMAEEAGVEVVTSAPVVDLVNGTGEIVNGVTVDLQGSRVRVAGRVVIAADGIESRVADMAGVDTTLTLGNMASAAQYLLEDIEIDSSVITIIIGNEIAPGGYAWIFPKSDKSANVGLAICPGRSNGKTAKEHLDRLVSSRFPHHKDSKLTMGAIPAFDPKIPLVHRNVMLVGDAGRLLDSLSGAGISNALISGSIAGEVAAKYLRNGGNLREYQSRFMKLKSRELHAYRLFRAIFLRATDADFDRIVQAIDDFFPQKEIRAINIPDVIFKLVLRNPRLLGLARYLVS